MTDTVMKSDVEKMIIDWESECAEYPALHNQVNVLLSRLKAMKPSLAINDFLAGMDNLTPVSFTSDDDALELLLTYGIKEKRNGVIEEDRRIFNAKTWAAVCYLCEEWDFTFIDTPYADALEDDHG